LTDLQILLVHANDDSEEDFPDKMQVQELVTRNFSNLTLLQLDINPKKYFTTWVLVNQSAMLVSVYYGRPGPLRLFKKSLVKKYTS